MKFNVKNLFMGVVLIIVLAVVFCAATRWWSWGRP